MPIIKKTSRFAKELKKPDEFITVTMGIAKFFQNYRRESFIVLSVLITGFLIWLGITTYKKYNFSLDSLSLSRTINDLQAVSQGKAGIDLSEIEKKLGKISKKYPGSTLGIRAAVLRAKLLEDKKDYVSAAQVFEKCGNGWSKGKDFKSLLLLNAAKDYVRAGEYTQALNIYDALLKDPAAQKDEAIYLQKAESLKKAGRNDELKQFIATSIEKVQDEIIKHRLRQISERSKN